MIERYAKMMKKALALALAAIFIASVLTSCASLEQRTAQRSPETTLDPKITVTSSDALDAAAWLDERLETIPDRVVIGTNAAEYDVDVSALEDDGYIIRDLGGEVALFARTEDGLDRAARKYAKAVEAGAAIADETYHEGYRIGAIELAGRDISEYTIYCPNEDNILASASFLAERIEEACGAKLSIEVGEKTAPYISLGYARDDALSTVGYRWTVDEGGLTIECSDGYKKSSSYCAVRRFLESELDWFGLYFGFEDLAEADSVSIPAGKSGGEVNAFQWVVPGTDDEPQDRFDNSYPYLCGIQHACHGLSNNKFGAELSKDPKRAWEGEQPCYLSEDFLEITIEDVISYIDARIDAGANIGEDLFYIDIAAGDNPYWCDCKKCSAMLRAEGTVAASVIKWANDLSSAVDKVHSGLAYQTFAYLGTNKAPKSVAPNDLVYVTYCYDTSCDMHAHDGRDCTTERLEHLADGHDNISRAAQLEAWLSLTKNVYVWYYSMGQGFMTLNYVGIALDDMRYFHEIGVKGFYMESHDGQTKDTCFGTLRAARWVMNQICWDIDMTDEEYSAYLDRVLGAIYGEDSASYIREYIDLTAAIQRCGPCTHCWWSASRSPTLVTKLIASSFDTLFELVESAIRYADSEDGEMRSTLLSAACIYQGCVSSYFDAYEAGDDDRCAELSKRYALIAPRLEKYGKDASKCWFGGWDGSFADFNGDMETMAWGAWKKYASFLNITVPTREAPERVSAILG